MYSMTASVTPELPSLHHVRVRRWFLFREVGRVFSRTSLQVRMPRPLRMCVPATCNSFSLISNVLVKRRQSEEIIEWAAGPHFLCTPLTASVTPELPSLQPSDGEYGFHVPSSQNFICLLLKFVRAAATDGPLSFLRKRDRGSAL